MTPARVPITMVTAQQNDQDDAQRMYWALSGILGSALGVDTGPSPYGDGQLTSSPSSYQVLNISTGTATAGRAATVTANLAGVQLTLPMLLVLGAAAWLLLRK